jgi:hypothetical protein
LTKPSMMQLRYAIALFHRKLTSDRWGFVPKRYFQHTPTGNILR